MSKASLKDIIHFSGFFYSSPIGILKVSLNEQGLTGIEFVTKQKPTLQIPPNAKNVYQQLEDYFAGKRLIFNLSLQLQGTQLQQKIWQELTLIPVGQTISYGELAAKVGTHPRVAAQACRRNPVSIVVPCHRVVAKSGLGGYAGRLSGKMLDIKKWLLDHEKNRITSNR